MNVLSSNIDENNNRTTEIFDANSKPYGLSYGEWTAKLWKWHTHYQRMSIPHTMILEDIAV